jgi:UDP-glucose-4-epimerase GalE
MNILVTGGAGYIGSHTCKQLNAAGYRAIVLDNLVQGHTWAVKWGPLRIGDIGDQQFVRSIIKEFDIAGVIHFAAHAYVGESMQNPQKYFKNNVANTLTFFDALLEGGVNKIVFSSSCATYGNPHELPIKETHIQQPVNPYGASKLMIENVLNWYSHAYDLRPIIFRYFNAAGADPDGDLGEEHSPETHLIPLVIAAAQGKNSNLEIFGTDYDTPDGTAVRDYIHVTDLASAHVKGIAHLLRGGNAEIMNLGTGEGHTIRKVISAVEAVSERKVVYKDGPRRPGDPASLVANAARAAAVLGWRPSLSNLETIVQTAWRWHEQSSRSLGRAVRGMVTYAP